MNNGICWNCGHFHEYHTIKGGCSFPQGQGTCDCKGYEDSEYFGEQKKRDLYTRSDQRKIIGRRPGR